MMSTVENITLSEFKDLLTHVKLPEKMRLTVTFEDNQSAAEILKKRRAFEAIHKLRGSGNGNLVKTLLKKRSKDKLR
jgi:hypothetical protein